MKSTLAVLAGALALAGSLNAQSSPLQDEVEKEHERRKSFYRVFVTEAAEFLALPQNVKSPHAGPGLITGMQGKAFKVVFGEYERIVLFSNVLTVDKMGDVISVYYNGPSGVECAILFPKKDNKEFSKRFIQGLCGVSGIDASLIELSGK